MTNENPDNAENKNDILYIGLDLGTSQSAIATSNNIHINTASVVGWPKDLISYKLHQKSILFGDECQKNRMSLDLHYPFEKGVVFAKRSSQKADDNDKVAQAPQEFIKHMLELAEPKEGQPIYLVVGAPAEATMQEKQSIIDAVDGFVDSVLVVSEPFLVAYGMNVYGFAMIVDIGAGTLDICRMHGTIPGDNDQKTTFKAGTYIDDLLFEMLGSKFPGGQINFLMARQYKEQYGFVGSANEQISVEIFINSQPTRCDISNELKEACESIVPDITSSLRKMIIDFDPEFQDQLRNNIIIAGCGSKIKGLGPIIESSLSDLGPVKVSTINDPIFAGAIGALRLGMDMPISEWQQL